MTNRDLIKLLLDRPMDAEVELFYPKKHKDEYGESTGYLYHINSVEPWGSDTILLSFTDWRDENRGKE